jgi:hypothetical protein
MVPINDTSLITFEGSLVARLRPKSSKPFWMKLPAMFTALSVTILLSPSKLLLPILPYPLPSAQSRTADDTEHAESTMVIHESSWELVAYAVLWVGIRDSVGGTGDRG